MSIQHLTATDYRTMLWENGLGQTVEMIRSDDTEGNLLWRLSMATVTEDGPFSLFPEIERNLTVLSGDGFDLIEEHSGITLKAALLTPVAFAGDTPITAKNVTSPCQDFNVMTRRNLPRPRVWVENQQKKIAVTNGSQLLMFALSPSTIQTEQGNITLETHELLLSQRSVTREQGRLICVALDASYFQR